MISCVDELMELDCQDMSVCGNDCTLEDGDPVRTRLELGSPYLHDRCVNTTVYTCGLIGQRPPDMVDPIDQSTPTERAAKPPTRPFLTRSSQRSSVWVRGRVRARVGLGLGLG